MNNAEEEMNREHTMRNKLSLSRKLIFGLSGVLIFLLITEIVSGKLLFAVSFIALFLGVTDFGRQCPLLLSVQYHVHRVTSKTKESITEK
jgi:hypothetical protein